MRGRARNRRGFDRRSGNRFRSRGGRCAIAFAPRARPHRYRGRRQDDRRRSRHSGRRRRWRGGPGGRRGSRWIAARGRRADRRRLRPGQEENRVEVAVRVRRQPHPEIDVRLRKLRHAARPDRADELSFPDRVAAPDGVRAQMQEGDRVTVPRPDRHRPSAPRDGSGEGDRSCCRRRDRRPRCGTDVDSAMLAGRVRIRAEREGHQHRTRDGPTPAESRRRNCQREGGDHENEHSHLVGDLRCHV
jgi:hypothetical protein